MAKGRTMTYAVLALAIALEIAASTLLDYSSGFTRLVPGVAALGCYGASLLLFSRVLLAINLSVAYATWCAVGIVATTIISVVVMHDEITPLGVFGVVLLVVGVAIVNLAAVPRA